MAASKQATMTKLVPAGHRVIIRPKPVEEVTKGGIVRPGVVHDLEKKGTTIGTVVAVGVQAWKTHCISAEDESVRGIPWAAVGDEVLFSRYSGSQVEDEIREAIDPTAERLVIVNDEDVLAVIIRR